MALANFKKTRRGLKTNKSRRTLKNKKTRRSLKNKKGGKSKKSVKKMKGGQPEIVNNREVLLNTAWNLTDFITAIKNKNTNELNNYAVAKIKNLDNIPCTIPYPPSSNHYHEVHLKANSDIGGCMNNWTYPSPDNYSRPMIPNKSTHAVIKFA